MCDEFTRLAGGCVAVVSGWGQPEHLRGLREGEEASLKT